MIDEILDEIRKSVVGKDEAIEKIICAFLAKGHILIEDIPGVGKTTMAMALAKVMRLKVNRMQFNPDVMPADVIGFHMYQKETGDFVYHEGPIMCNLFLADEINRTTAKTQSALLEVMEEGTVTVDGITRLLPSPFIVIATQNPAGSAGTQLLPDSQLDRFIIKLSMGYPDERDEITILKQKRGRQVQEEVRPIVSEKDILRMQEETANIYVHTMIYEYAVKLANKTRNHPMLELGISPRGTIALISMAQARAYIKGRQYVLPEDIRSTFLDVTGHRVLLNARARVNHMSATEILTQILEEVPAPKPVK